jgi:hypothetical protein
LINSPEEQIATVMADPLGFLYSFVTIPNKERVPVPFIPWPVQERLVRELTGRDLVVKDSQCGSTTIFSGMFLQDSIVHNNTTTVIMAHQEFTTQRLLWRCKIMLDSLPDFIRPRLDHKGASELRFPDLNSVMYVATAKADVAGRGEPIHNLLLSEASFYGAGTSERIVIPAIQRVPPGGRVIIESTPNGMDEIMYAEYQKIQEETSTFKMHTVYWWDNPDNIAPPEFRFSPDNEKGDFDWTPDELSINQVALTDSKRELTMEQIRWRRWKIRETGRLFFQEHLESLDTCFLMMGSPYYNTMRVAELMHDAYPAPYGGPYDSHVWFKPEPGHWYIVGIDPGQGKVTESVASVWDLCEDGHVRHCARLSTMDDPLVFDEPVLALAQYYNMAMINPEANGHGAGLIKGLRGYPNLYHRQNIASGRVTGNEIGWLTTGTTKPFMLQQMGFRLDTLETYDQRLIEQISGWRRSENLKPPVNIGMTDHFMAAALGIVPFSNTSPPGKRGFKGFTGWNW